MTLLVHVSGYVASLSLCLVEMILRREKLKREKKSRNRQFLLFGLSEKLRREKEFCVTHCFFLSLQTSEESDILL
jgi:hypothetical protein